MVEMTAARTLLECLDAVHRQRPDLGFSALVTFLLVCEHEGVNVKELAFLSCASQSVVSRSISALRTGCRGRSESLVAIERDDHDRRRSRVYLTEDGRALKDEIAILFEREHAPTSAVRRLQIDARICELR